MSLLRAMAVVRRTPLSIFAYQSEMKRSLASGSSIILRVDTATSCKRHTLMPVMTMENSKMTAKPRPRRTPILTFLNKFM
ncbi:hypothetical protein D3C81_1461620 [compost metagenome]